MAGSLLFLTASAQPRWTLTTATRQTFRHLGPNTGRNGAGALTSTTETMRREVIGSGNWAIVRARSGGRADT